MSECLSSFELASEDILAQRRLGSDVRWAVREWEEVVSYKYRKKMSNKELFKQILKSDRVSLAINKQVNEGKSRKMLIKEVFSVLEDMCHTLDIGMVRKFAVVLPKIMKRIYRRILVNPSGIEMIKRVSAETPIIFIPTHRSYADFLLISYIAFHYNLPFPVIAAGMDFMSMAVVGDMLRGAGAFYIRRSFMDDTIYWAVFQEYVQCLLCESGQPMEFFLEGTRSRSGKSLPPKLGLLGCVVECWLRGRVPDVIIIPISISYNRTLEEKLYAYEMLGVPKPKESTSGLLKAMKILKEDFGDIYVNIGQGLSIHEFLSARVNLHLTRGPPHSSSSSLSGQEFDACEALGLLVTNRLQESCVVSVWSLVCVTLLRCLWGSIWSLPLSSLLQETLKVVRWAGRLGAVVEGGGSMESVEYHLKRGLAVHRDTALLTTDGVVRIQIIHRPNQGPKEATRKVDCSVAHLLLQYYVNQVLHFFIRPILVCLALSHSEEPSSRDQLLAKFDLLRSIFSFDFIFEKHLCKKDFDFAFTFLEEEGCVERRADYRFAISKEAEGETKKNLLYTLLIDLVQPFLLNYQVALKVAGDRPAFKDESCLVVAIQEALEVPAADRCLFSALSLDTCRQAAKMLVKMELLTKLRGSDGKCQLVPNPQAISALTEVLCPSLAVELNLRSKL